MPSEQPRRGLTSPEVQLLEPAAVGHTNHAIAHTLGISPPDRRPPPRSHLPQLNVPSRDAAVYHATAEHVVATYGAGGAK